jgi:syntaxin 5
VCFTYSSFEIVAKRKSLFDDPAIEIQELTAVINQDIKNINQQISFLQQQKDLLQRNRSKSKQSATHSETVVEALKAKLKSTTKNFSNVLQLRTEVSAPGNLFNTVTAFSHQTHMEYFICTNRLSRI